MDPGTMLMLANTASSAANGGGGGGGDLLSGLSSLLGRSESFKSTEPFLKQYAGGLLGSLFFPQFAQAFASYKPQEYQQLFGQPGQKLSKSKGKVANTGMMGMGAGGFAEDPNSPLGINGSIGQYRRFVSQYRPFDYLASNPFGREGGPSQGEQDLLNNSYFGLVPKIDLSKANNAADALHGLLGNLSPANFGSQFKQVASSYPQTAAIPPMPSANPMNYLRGLFLNGR